MYFVDLGGNIRMDHRKQIMTLVRMIRSLIEHCPYSLACETCAFQCFTLDLNLVLLFWGSYCLLVVFETFHEYSMLSGSILWIREAR